MGSTGSVEHDRDSKACQNGSQEAIATLALFKIKQRLSDEDCAPKRELQTLHLLARDVLSVSRHPVSPVNTKNMHPVIPSQEMRSAIL
jgi:hypothetical protein